MQQINYSLERLGIVYVDFYISHRWEYLASSKRNGCSAQSGESGKNTLLGSKRHLRLKVLEITIRGGKPRIGSLVSMQSHMDLIYM